MNKINFDFGAVGCFDIESVADYVNNGSDVVGFEHLSA